MQIEPHDKILIRVGEILSWCRVDSIDRKTLIIPIFRVTVLHGDYAGQTVATTSCLDRAKAGHFISHEFPAPVNA